MEELKEKVLEIMQAPVKRDKKYPIGTILYDKFKVIDHVAKSKNDNYKRALLCECVICGNKTIRTAYSCLKARCKCSTSYYKKSQIVNGWEILIEPYYNNSLYKIRCLSCNKEKNCGPKGFKINKCQCSGYYSIFKGNAKLSRRLAEYKSEAKQRGHVFELTNDRFKELVSSNCFYCNSKPKEYIGIDRIDSSKGYIEGNVVSSCSQCNRAKMDETLSDFINWVKITYNNLISKGF